MNYNPYYFTPYAAPQISKGLFSGLFGKGISFSSILSGTQKTLNIVNQAIPMVKQVTPMFKNAKTMFQVMNEFKKIDTPKTSDENINTETVNQTSTKYEKAQYINDSSPTFFQ